MNKIRLEISYRIAALIVNGLAIGGIGFLALAMLYLANCVEHIGTSYTTPGFYNRIEKSVAIVTIIAVIINALAEALTGHNLGKYILGIRIGTHDGKVGSPGFYLKRYLVKNLYLLVLFPSFFIQLKIDQGGIGEIYRLLLTMSCIVSFGGCLFAIGRQRQALHDMISGSALYKRSDLV